MTDDTIEKADKLVQALTKHYQEHENCECVESICKEVFEE